MCYIVAREPKECSVGIKRDSRPVSEETLRWYAMSAPYRREFIARDIFKAEGLEYFLPLQRVVADSAGGRKRLVWRPAIASMIFVRATRSGIQSLKQRRGVVQYLTRPVEGRNEPITVPDREMADFRRAILADNEKTVFLRPEEIDISKGTLVRITGGPLNGCTGAFMKVSGVRGRRLVIKLEGLGAVATQVDPDFVEIINPQLTI